MFSRIRRVVLTGTSALALGAFAVPAAQANVLSLLSGSCGNQAESQPFAAFGDDNSYTLIPGGDFQGSDTPWLLGGGASAGDGSLSLPAGSSATSPANCTSLSHPSMRMFVRNTGSPSSKLIVKALYPGLLGGVQTATIGEFTGSADWSPSPAMSIETQNLLATLSLSQTVIAFRLTPADDSGSWSVENVYLDPYSRH